MAHRTTPFQALCPASGGDPWVAPPGAAHGGRRPPPARLRDRDRDRDRDLGKWLQEACHPQLAAPRLRNPGQLRTGWAELWLVFK